MSQDVSQIIPEYTRLPKAGKREPFTQLSRATLDRLVRAQPCNNFRPPVASKTVRVRGNRATGRGVRLISLKSLLDYLGRQPAGVSTVEEEVVR
jgi:hypothetical protein